MKESMEFEKEILEKEESNRDLYSLGDAPTYDEISKMIKGIRL